MTGKCSVVILFARATASTFRFSLPAIFYPVGNDGDNTVSVPLPDLFIYPVIAEHPYHVLEN